MATPLDNLVYCLGLNEASGDALDLSGNGLDFTQQGTVPAATGHISGARGPFTTANYFNRSVSDALRILDQSCAWGLWVKRVAGTSSGTVLNLRNVSTPVYEINIASSNTYLMIKSGTGAGSLLLGPAIADDTWTWCFAWYNAVTAQFGLRFNNGTPVTATLPGGHSDDPTATLVTVGVGGPTPGTNNARHLEQLCFWKGRIPTQREQDGIYNAGAGVTFDAFGDINSASPTSLRMDHRLLAPRRF